MWPKYEFSDWMLYEERYWHEAPEQPGVVQTRDAKTGKTMFFTSTREGSVNPPSVRGRLGNRDPAKNFRMLSGHEKCLIKGGGKLEFRFAITNSAEDALNLKKLLIHRHVREHGNKWDWQVSKQCPRGRSGGCTICKE